MRADARRNYERIVAVARELFAEKGTEVPLDDVVKRAEVGAGTLYRHFPNRDALVEAVYREEIEALADYGRKLVSGAAPEDVLPLWFREQVQFFTRKKGLTVALKASLDKEREVFSWAHSVLHEVADEVLAAAREHVRPEVTRVDLLRLGHGLCVATERATPEEADRILDVVVSGLRPA
ncbi:TetR/AcrR family transcriptional regulator [Amycolatopsis sp. 195334CR]|uniref:TetR/AcrR family transcriptional regulator n=1 Tax=Amycolatopsis sp. 195334CR TaxID=2814588 RepID=UPI001A8DBE47|nr:TetR/AcrR family transcriptional regulator [Amycolatopsis sp. 195334CR]MBN6041483.1 TetR/AcrR family transcriptional regulator [Amycolatopsis sp. 195334CR]